MNEMMENEVMEEEEESESLAFFLLTIPAIAWKMEKKCAKVLLSSSSTFVFGSTFSSQKNSICSALASFHQ